MPTMVYLLAPPCGNEFDIVFIRKQSYSSYCITQSFCPYRAANVQ